MLERRGGKRTAQLPSFNSFPEVFRLPVTRRLLSLVFIVFALVSWTGCGESDRFSYAAETDEPNYREGVSLLKAGRRQEALSSFLKVIDKRREDAPESHMEVGLLYAQHINDPLSAIYHFRKYLAMRPNSPQAPLVRQRIDAAIREFARTLPAQPVESQTQRVDLVATLDRLKQENEALKQQLAEARSKLGSVVTAPVEVPPAVATRAPATTIAAPSGDNPVTFSFDPVPTVRTRPPVVSTQRTPAPAATPTPLSTPTRPAVQVPTTTRPASTPATTVAPAGRRHTVRPGDTLSKLAQQYYNNRAKWRDIYSANRDVMRSESDIKVGMILKIP